MTCKYRFIAQQNTFYKLLTLLKVCAEQEEWGDGNAEGIEVWHCGGGSLLTNCYNATTRFIAQQYAIASQLADNSATPWEQS